MANRFYTGGDGDTGNAGIKERVVGDSCYGFFVMSSRYNDRAAIVSAPGNSVLVFVVVELKIEVFLN